MKLFIWTLPLCSFAALLAGLWAPDFSTNIGWLLLGSQFGIDAMNRPFLVVSGCAWLIASLLAQDTLFKDGRARNRFAFALTLFGTIITVLSQDLVTFYTGFAVMSLAAYGMVVTASSTEQRFAGRIYISLAIAGELLLFAAMVGLFTISESILFPFTPNTAAPLWLTLCILLGFGIKAGLVPLHVTLPLIYRAAPLACGIALAGAALNVGILGWLRWLPATEVDGFSGLLVVSLACVGYVYAILVGLTQSDPRALLGYSSISQVALIAMVIGISLITPDNRSVLITGALLMMTQHAIAKTYLFTATAGRPVNRVTLVVWWIGIAVAGSGLAGAPLTGGYAAKLILSDAVAMAEETRLLGDLLWLSSLFTTLLILRFAWLMYRNAAKVTTSIVHTAYAISFTALAITSFLAITSLSWSPVSVTISAIPIIIAVAFVTFLMQYPVLQRKISSLNLISIPAGDIAHPICRSLRQIKTWSQNKSSSLAYRLNYKALIFNRTTQYQKIAQLAGTVEPRWSNAAASILTCIVVLALTLILFMS